MAIGLSQKCQIDPQHGLYLLRLFTLFDYVRACVPAVALFVCASFAELLLNLYIYGSAHPGAHGCPRQRRPVYAAIRQKHSLPSQTS